MPVTVLAKAVCWLKLAQKESVSTISTFLVQLRYYYWFNYTQFCSCFCYTSLKSASNVNSPQMSLFKKKKRAGSGLSR